MWVVDITKARHAIARMTARACAVSGARHEGFCYLQGQQPRDSPAWFMTGRTSRVLLSSSRHINYKFSCHSKENHCEITLKKIKRRDQGEGAAICASLTHTPPTSGVLSHILAIVQSSDRPVRGGSASLSIVTMSFCFPVLYWSSSGILFGVCIVQGDSCSAGEKGEKRRSEDREKERKYLL